MTFFQSIAFLPGGVGGGEILLVFVLILVLFGPRRLPEVARNIGKAMEVLRRTSQEFKDQVMRIGAEEPVYREPEGNAGPDDAGAGPETDGNGSEKDAGDELAG